MEADRFINVAAKPGNSKWKKSVMRIHDLSLRKNDIRTDFERDYNRILHCAAYRRLKHKTQVFYATRNDLICTRIEHVNHVNSVSYTIAKFLGLNTGLTTAIALGHDLGHAPFGHSGEKILNSIAVKVLGTSFWHEKNGLRVVDKIETLENSEGKEKNLNLTYAVRDGIVSHCGEVNEKALFPRENSFDLEKITKPNEYPPYTWEGCVVKIADKISYLGRDIEDALRLDILSDLQLDELKKIVRVNLKEINNTILMHDFVTDLCKNSSPARGICLSSRYLDLINHVKAFNYANIYHHKRLNNYIRFAELILHSVYDTLEDLYDGKNTLKQIDSSAVLYPELCSSFKAWLEKYSDHTNRKKNGCKFENEVLYHAGNRNDHTLAIIDFMSSMTDHFAIRVFNELTSF
jgi:dGTPase